MLPAPGPMIFDYKDPKGISAVSLTLDAPLEPIVGYAKGVSGTVRFDPAHPERSNGRLAVDVDSVQFANDGYTATARGYALNGKRWPQLTLAVRRMENVRRLSSTRYAGTVIADFTCRGITKTKRLVGTADYFPGRAEERTNGAHKGDLLVLRTRFSVSRKEHGISEGIPDSMVGDTVEVGVAVVGIHYTITPPLQVARLGEGAGGRGRWLAEFADRDDPLLVRIERTGDRLRLETAKGGVGATITGEEKSRLSFRLDPNDLVGDVTGELGLDGRGVVHTKEGDVALRGRPVDEFLAPPTLPEPRGVGFTGLPLARKMREGGTAGMAVARIVGRSRG